jgi:hypothetical protein
MRQFEDFIKRAWEPIKRKMESEGAGLVTQDTCNAKAKVYLAEWINAFGPQISSLAPRDPEDQTLNLERPAYAAQQSRLFQTAQKIQSKADWNRNKTPKILPW